VESVTLPVHDPVFFAHGYGLISTVAIAIGGVSIAVICFIVAGAMTLQSPLQKPAARRLIIVGVVSLLLALLSPVIAQTLKLP
jgi:hypothetical protein